MSTDATVRRVVVCLALIVGFAYWWPAFRAPHSTGFGDWQMIHHNWEVGRVALSRHGELPLFDPYHCGGVTMLGNPESQLFSPLFLLAFPLGTTLATKVFIALHTAAAILGGAHYARRVALLSWPASLLTGLVFALSGFFAWQLAGGHATFAPFAFLPWLHLALRASETNPRASILGGGLLALTIMEGGTYPFPYMLVSLAVAALFRMGTEPASAARVVRGGVVMFALGVLASAHRILPVRDTLARLPRTASSEDASSLSDVLAMLTAREHDWGFDGHEFVWPEYGSYVGFGVLALVALGVLRGRRPEGRVLVAEHVLGAVVATLLIAGNVSRFHPWVLLRDLPVYDSLRVPSRFASLLTFHLAVLAGLGLDWLDARALTGRARRVRTGVAFALVLGAVTDIIIVTRPIVDRWAGAPIDGTAHAPMLWFGRTRAYDDVYASFPERNESTTLCYIGGMNWSVSPAIRQGPVPQAWTTAPGASVLLRRRTPTRYVIEVDAPRGARVVVNQNFDPGFRTSVGRVADHDGLLAVDVGPGTRRVSLEYRPRTLIPSVAVAAATLCACAYGLYAMRRWPRALGGSA